MPATDSLISLRILVMKPHHIAIVLGGAAACSRTPAATSPAPTQARVPAAAQNSATVAAASVTPPSSETVPAKTVPKRLVAQPLPLPGASGPASLDFIFYEPLNARVWVPAGSTGSVDVLDVRSGTFTRIEGFATAEREGHGKKRTVGPSAGAVGNGFAYIGNRATSEVCPIDVKALKAAKCIKMSSGTDGVEYVAASKEVWVALPKEQTLAVLDASNPSTLKQKATVKVDGSPECYAVDEGHGIFFTNLEDKNGTVAIDIKTRKVTATWNAECGPDGPRGVAYDASHDFIIVACTDHVQVLDASHDGAPLGKLDTGAGVDNIDYEDQTHLLYVAAGKAARLTVGQVDDKGRIDVVAMGETSEGARNAVVDANGNVYVADSQQGRLLVFRANAPAP